MELSKSPEEHKFSVTLHEGADSRIAMPVAFHCMRLVPRQIKCTSRCTYVVDFDSRNTGPAPKQATAVLRESVSALLYNSMLESIRKTYKVCDW